MVRLPYSQESAHQEMWYNAAVFIARAGGNCGRFLHEFKQGRVRLILFFPDEHSSAEIRFHFDEFILALSRQGLARIAQRFNRFFEGRVY